MDQIERDNRRIGWFLWILAFTVIILIGYSQRPDQVAVEVPVVDSQLIQRLQAERDHVKRESADKDQLIAQLKAMVKASNITVAQLTDQLKALSVSVPSQPIILEAVRKEASTPAGFRQVVARNFGTDIAKRVRVME